jgi:hypothetical protein
LVLALLRTSLDNADFVQEVVEVGGPLSPDILVEAYLSALEGDFTVKDKPVAVVGVEFVVLSVPDPPEAVSPLLRRAYVRRLPLSEKTAAAVANAWNQGLSELVAEFLADMKTALPPAATKPSRRAR